MASQTTATELLALARQRAYEPVSGGPSDSAILRDLNAELITYVAPLLVEIGEEFTVATEDFDTEANVGAYDIPAKSIGSKIRDVQVLADDNTSWLPLAHEEPERAAAYAQTASRPVAYFVRGNHIHLLPTPAANGQSMRIVYYRRPRQIVNSGYAAASAVSGPSLGEYTVTVDTTGMASGDFDILDADTYEIISEGLPGTVDGGEITFAAADLTAAQITALLASVGDVWIGSDKSLVADVPQEAAVLLALRVAAVILQEKTDPRSVQVFAEIERVKKTLQSLFAPRASGRARKIVNRAGPGWGAWRWGWRGSGNY